MRTRLSIGIASIALAFGLAASAQAVGPIVSIEVSPSSTSVSAGQKTTFTVIGKDADGVTADLTANSTFTTTDLAGSLAANVYTAGTAGTSTIRATYSTLTADATVSVAPGVIAEVVVNPNSAPERIANGKTRDFAAEAFDAYNNAVKSFSVDWNVEGTLGTVKSTARDTARFTATTEGSGRIVAKIGEIKGFVDVVVAPSVITTNTNAGTNPPITGVNSNQNRNVTNANAAVNENTNTANTNTSTPTTESVCKPWFRTAWVWMYVGYLILLAGSLWAVRRMKPTWWWAAPLVLTVGALWVYFQFRCYPVYPGLPYLVLLAAVVGASWYTWQRGSTPTQS